MLPIDLPHARPNYWQNKCMTLYIRAKVDCFRDKCTNGNICNLFYHYSPQRHMGRAWAYVSDLVVGAECKAWRCSIMS
jgi:hypothetical protein